MAESSQLLVKYMSHIPTKIDVVKFDDTNNFRKWRYEVMHALMTSNFEESLCLEEKTEETPENDRDKMNQMVYNIIRSCLT